MTEPPVSINVHHQLSSRQVAQLLRSITKEEPVTVPTKAAPATPGWKTTEFWVSLLATVGAVAAAQQNAVPDRYAAYVAMVSTIAYAISRGLAKH